MADVVEETVFVLDMDAAFAVAGKVRREAYGKAMPECASHIIGVSRLAFPSQLIEIASGPSCREKRRDHDPNYEGDRPR
jgi:hypothetical protein